MIIMQADKRVAGKALISILKSIRDRRKEELLDYIYENEPDKKEEDIKLDVSFEDSLLRKGDIITISPVYSAVITPDGFGGMELGDIRFSEEVWEVLAVNSLHIKIKRVSDLSGNFKNKVFIVQKDDYKYSFADDFVE